MVYEKKKSGDPDYDDKQPPQAHSGPIVTAGDGREVMLSESAGPVDPATGAHVDLDDPEGKAPDNRPKPGGVAKEASEVQTYTPGDTPAVQMAKDAMSVDEAKESDDADPAPDTKVAKPEVAEPKSQQSRTTRK